MQIQYVANSCFLIRLASGRRLLTDPWFKGPCQQTWWNYPPVHAALTRRVEACRPDWIYISHLHHDHLHAESLRGFARETPVLIGRMNTPNLRGALQRMGFERIVEQPFEEPFALEPDGCRAVLFSDFHATTAGDDSGLDYDLDTSIYLLDADGARVFNAVDNTIQPDDAARIRARFGTPHVAMVPYASASIFPMGMSDYDDAQKLAAAQAVKRRTARRFAEVATALGTEIAIPAGGEYVLGGPAAAQSRFLPQPLEDELREAMAAQGGAVGDGAAEAVVKLYPGDSLDTADLAAGPVRDSEALRDGSDERRAAYAMTLADRTPDYARVAVEALQPDWGRILGRCSKALVARCARIGYAPAMDLVLRVRDYASGVHRFDYAVRLDDGGAGFMEPGAGGERARLVYSLDERLLFCLVSGLLSWNAMEASALIGLTRRPDVYDPEIHRVIVYFTMLS